MLPFLLLPRRRRMLLGWLVPLLAGLVSPARGAADAPAGRWPQFRGPGSLPSIAATNLPVTWGTNQNVAWRVAVPGAGWSSPIVWDDAVFLTTVVSDAPPEPPKKGLYFGGERPRATNTGHWLVLCLDTSDGHERWRREVHQGPPVSRLHVKNSPASETPVTDGERVYAYFGNVGLFCLDFAGRPVWEQKFAPHETRNGWGTAASPVLHRDRVYVVNDNEEHSTLAAYDTRTGREVWRVAREEKSNWATPFAWEHDGRTEIVTPGTGRIRSYDLEGHPLWELGGMSSIAIPTPFAHAGLLHVSSGYVGDKVRPLFAIRPGATGDITLRNGARTNEFIAWSEPAAGPYNPSPLIHDGHYYILYDFGFLGCRDPLTGREVYARQRLNATGTAGFTASPWAYSGRVFCLSEDGDTYVVQAGPEYRLLGVNALGEMCLACPAVAGDRLLIRTAASLFCLREGGRR